MSTHQYMTYAEDGEAFVTYFAPSVGHPLTATTATHPNFASLVQALKNGDPEDEIVAGFDVEQAVSNIFEALSERVSVKNGRVYFDGDEVNSALSRQIMRFIEDGIPEDQWYGLVLFMENVAANPSDNSREQLYTWLADRDFTITDSGTFIAYKGVEADFRSVRSGPGIVNGEAVNGKLDNSPGNVLEIARSIVVDNAAVGCASGLHVGTYDYAKSWSRGTVVKVEVNPRDVVSVPTDCDAQKVRVCRYTVIDAVTEPLNAALFSAVVDTDDDWDEEDYCGCGDLDCPYS